MRCCCHICVGDGDAHCGCEKELVNGCRFFRFFLSSFTPPSFSSHLPPSPHSSLLSLHSTPLASLCSCSHSILSPRASLLSLLPCVYIRPRPRTAPPLFLFPPLLPAFLRLLFNKEVSNSAVYYPRPVHLNFFGAWQLFLAVRQWSLAVSGKHATVPLRSVGAGGRANRDGMAT